MVGELGYSGMAGLAGDSEWTGRQCEGRIIQSIMVSRGGESIDRRDWLHLDRLCRREGACTSMHSYARDWRNWTRCMM